jgi:hypothetical protein
MAVTVNSRKRIRNSPTTPPASDAPSINHVNTVSSVLGAKVDFLSWQKNFSEIRSDPFGVSGSVWVNFVTDSAKLLEAAKEAGAKIPGVGSILKKH